MYLNHLQGKYPSWNRRIWIKCGRIITKIQIPVLKVLTIIKVSVFWWKFLHITGNQLKRGSGTNFSLRYVKYDLSQSELLGNCWFLIHKREYVALRKNVSNTIKLNQTNKNVWIKSRKILYRLKYLYTRFKQNQSYVNTRRLLKLYSFVSAVV